MLLPKKIDLYIGDILINLRLRRFFSFCEENIKTVFILG